MAELHLEDGCALFTNGTLNDIPLLATSAGNVSFVCKMDIQCSRNWTRYVDDGSEGHDSCLSLSGGSTSISASASWTSAMAMIPHGSHALTISSRNFSGASALSSAIRTAVTASGYFGSLAYAGCAQSTSSSGTNTGWYWIDGTPANNLNCGGTGCGAWSNSSTPQT